MMVFAFSAGRLAGAAPDAASTRPVVLGYYPSWKSGLEPPQINYGQFTHICHAFIMADTSGSLKMEGNMPSRDLTSRAHAAGVKVLLSLGGMDSGVYFGPMMRDPDAGERFIQAVARVMLDYEYDGIDLDWEFTSNETDKASLTRMARRFREIFREKKPGALLTSAQSGTRWACRFVDAEALLPLLDYVNVMTYDVHGPWGSHAGFNAPLHPATGDKDECSSNCVEGQIAYWEKNLKWPKNKLLVGIPGFGRGFVVNQWHESFNPKVKPGHPYLPYDKVAGMLKDGWTRSWDSAACVPWLSKSGVKEIITYDDEQSAALKGRWASDHGCAGIFFWEISQDFIAGRNALVEAASRAYEQEKGK